jgi:hypothetical protein
MLQFWRRARTFSFRRKCNGARSFGLVEFPLLRNPLFKWTEERRHHVKLVRTPVPIHALAAGSRGCWYLFILFESWKFRERVPVYLANLLPRSRFEVGISRNASDNVEPHVLLAHWDLNVFRLLFLFGKPSGLDIKSGFFVDFTYCAVKILFTLVDLSPGEAPVGTFLPAFYEDDMLHLLVEKDSATDRNTGFVGQEFRKRCRVVMMRPFRHQRTMLENAESELPKTHRGEIWVQRPYKILVKPLGLFDLETYSLDRLQFFAWEVDDEANTKVI